MSGPSKVETITEEFVIQGLLKEAMLLESEFYIDSLALKLKLVDVFENQIRGHSHEKKLIFKIVSDAEKFLLNKEKIYPISSRFYRSQIEFESYFFEANNDNSLIFSVPIALKMLDFRKTGRSEVSDKFRKPFPLLVHTNGLHCEGIFIMEDTSIDGFGGTLHVPSGFPVNSNTTIVGEMIIEYGELKVRSKIVRATQNPLVKHNFDTYKIGAVQTIKEEKHKVDKENMRKSDRHRITHKVKLKPLIHPDFQFDFDMIDISITGFSGKPSSGATIPPLPIGSMFLLNDSKAKVHLIHFDNDILHFNIDSSNERDAIDWLRTMTPLLHKGATCRVKDAKDLYKVFLQAGAISSQYLKRHAFFESSLSVDQKGFSQETGYLHRWYVGNENGEVEAYISAIRVSNSGWNIGDISKVAQSGVNGEMMIKNFFHSFSSLCQELIPCPVLMVTWLIDHPLWQKWRTTILKRRESLVLSEVIFSYFRVSREMLAKPPSQMSLSCREIKASDYQTIKYIQESFEDVNILTFSRCILDFDYLSFGSRGLGEVCFPAFFRKYYLLEVGDCACVVVLTKYPEAKSTNRIMDSAYILPMKRQNLQTQDVTYINFITYKLSVELGVLLPGIRYVFSSHGRDKDGIDQSSLECYVLTPEAFRMFEGLK